MQRYLHAVTAVVFAVALGAVAPGVFAGGLETKLASEDRAEADRARDSGRKPAAVIQFLGIEPGMTVVDLLAAGGYYTEVLSLAVGSDGKVYAQNTRFGLEMRDGINEKAISARLGDGRLPNVERLDREFADLGLEPASIDAAVTALNFHDVYNGRSAEAAVRFLKAVYVILKPGGVLGVIDHSGGVGDDKELHRIDEKHATESAGLAGFVVEAVSDVLRNPDDDRSAYVFDPAIRGATDRFALRLRKPAAAETKE